MFYLNYEIIINNCFYSLCDHGFKLFENFFIFNFFNLTLDTLLVSNYYVLEVYISYNNGRAWGWDGPITPEDQVRFGFWFFFFIGLNLYRWYDNMQPDPNEERRRKKKKEEEQKKKQHDYYDKQIEGWELKDDHYEKQIDGWEFKK